MIHRYLALAVTLAMMNSPLAAQNVRAGIEAWQNAEYTKAVDIWRPLAEGGDADAQFNLGQAYRLGRGVPTNLAAANTWFERAAAQNHVEAETTLGLMLFQSGNQAEGLKYLKRAADKGESRAMLIYGTALVNGDTVTQDPTTGYAYVSRAAAQGLEPAKDTLKQLDDLIPLADRKRGLELAMAMAKAAPPPGSKPARIAAAKPAKPAPAKSAPVKPHPPAKASAAAGGKWRVQLGAFSQKGSAQALYSRLSGALGGRQAYYIPAGNVTRLQVGPFASRAEAGAACARLKGQACFPVTVK